jgi:hypothetical protein
MLFAQYCIDGPYKEIIPRELQDHKNWFCRGFSLDRCNLNSFAEVAARRVTHLDQEPPHHRPDKRPDVGRAKPVLD